MTIVTRWVGRCCVLSVVLAAACGSDSKNGNEAASAGSTGDSAGSANQAGSNAAGSGTAGADQFYRQAFEVLPDAEFTVKWTAFGGDSLLAAWTATASAGHVDDGVDTLSFTDGTIRLHASFFTITPNETADSAR